MTDLQKAAEAVSAQATDIHETLRAINDGFDETKAYALKMRRERDRLDEVAKQLSEDRDRLLRQGKRLLAALDKEPWTGVEDLKQDREGRPDVGLREAIVTIEERMDGRG
jgi:hypothetical protein